ncbi:MarR family transcriptional regulator [Cardiobacteriaceae bacterium TAE3-ERU3]|nr:MarR family transcriptional regulator [Cardiobacteriaceae bacterium TAE3-ERU3]
MAQPSKQIGDIVLSLFRLNGLLLAWGDHFASSAGLTSARWQVLGALSLADDPMTAPQIAERMGVTRQGVQKQLNLLLDDGCVEKRANRMHKRSPLYVLTDKGEALFQRISNLWDNHAAEWAKTLTTEQLDQTQNTLNQLTNIINEENHHEKTNHS